MFQSLDIFRTAGAMARHATARQAVVASNVAHSDTPAYRARDIADFVQVWSPDPAMHMRATRSTHLNGTLGHQMPSPRVVEGLEAAPNGNTVSLEEELMKGAAARQEHDRALAIYRSAVTVLRSSLGRR